MAINIIAGEILKRMKLNQLIYKNQLFNAALTNGITNELPDEQMATAHLSKASPKPVGKSYSSKGRFPVKYDLEIIVAAYNAEPYIDDCIGSIVNQKTDYSFSVTIVNDGSTDNTLQFLKKYEAISNVKVIDQANRGFAGSRNRGLDATEGRYLMLIDSDDKLAENAVQKLLEAAFSTDSDIVEGSYLRFHKDNNILTRNIHNDGENVAALENLNGFPWGKVIKSNLFENVRFPKDYWFDDTIFRYLIFTRCQKATTISDIVYWYRRNKNGISRQSRKSSKSIDTFWVTEQMFADMKTLGIAKKQELYDATLNQIQLNFRRTSDLPVEIRKSIFVLSTKLLKQNFPNFRTKNSAYHDLENALLERDYQSYHLFCTLV
ncbi:hypothetical protein BSQ39_02095 [Loigolactobacillus backii]|uniref:glycosyltransferase family 2 protein n=1 Tax=Loigolactobacillus backii TaxID=375175 RepID=UPI000C1C9E35|nr:glycosyltransferase family 2 protein [Loigolactobacillus backii]PIO82437.1 hypothetical protein BSQ39_02095 [Loigolactobacillus backii]